MNFDKAYIKTEGAHIHPDDPVHGYGGDDDQRYKRQLEGYCEDNNLDLEFETENCLRPELWNTDGEDIDHAEYSREAAQ